MEKRRIFAPEINQKSIINQSKKTSIMKSLVWVILQSVIVDGKEIKSIHNVYLFKSQAQDRMNEIVVEFEDKQDDQGNFLWDCERPWWNIANFKSNTHEFSMRIEVVEREIEL